MILGLDLDAWVKIVWISLLIFSFFFTVIELLTGRLTIELVEVEEEEDNGTKKDKNRPPK